MKIICKTTLLPFVGSRIRLRLDDIAMKWRISNILLAEGCETATVDWGDGVIEKVTGGAATHAYTAVGLYEVKISDEISSLAVNSNTLNYGSVLAFCSTAARLEKLNAFCFSGAADLTEVDVRESGVNLLGRGCFGDCTSLAGELFFPKVTAFTGSATLLPFRGCTGGITKIHFAAANEAAIRATDQFKADATLGTGTAVCVFDL